MNKHRYLLYVTLTLLLLFCISEKSVAHSYQKEGIHIGHIWTYDTSHGSTTAELYGPLLNTAKIQDTLLGASSSLADSISIEDVVPGSDPIHSQQRREIELDPNKPVSLVPSGIHLLVQGLKHPLLAGKRFPLVLEFKNAGKINIEAVIDARPNPTSSQ